MTCQYPQHHKPGRSSGLLLAALAVVAYIVIRLALVVVRFIEAWWWVPVAAIATAAVIGLVVRFASRGKSRLTLIPDFRAPKWLRHLPRSAWAAARWRHLARNLGLAYPDKHAGGIRHPRARILPGPHGPVARVRTVPGSGRAEFDQAAEHIANAWRCSRVSVAQPKPGRLVVRGLRRDPLLDPFDLSDLLVRKTPPGGKNLTPGSDSGPRRLYLGRDEHGSDRWADLANVPGIAVGGMPGSGKSTEITGWLVQLAPHPEVQMVNLDGKGAGEFGDFEPRAWLTGGDDLDEAIGILETVHGLMTDRLAAVRKVLGSKNAWHAGPSADWPLVVTVIDECQQYFDLTMVKGDKEAEPKVRRAIFLASSLIRRGRSVAMLTIPATQKPTGDSMPTAIRDNCPLAMSFAARTTDAAAATLGSAIRDYPSYSPAGLALPEYTGVATVTLRTGQDPFTRLRGPWVSEDQAAAAAAATAHLRRDPRATLPVVVPDTPESLVGA